MLAQMLVPVTAIYGALLALFLVILTVPVIKLRQGLRVGLGDGGQTSLQQAVRAHGNAAEFIPLFIVLLAVYEINHAPAIALHIFGVVFILSRLAHASGLYQTSGASSGRVAGMIGTLTALVALAIANVIQVIR
jgi:uncharacterized membrane protein YecN with MAPEG domain